MMQKSLVGVAAGLLSALLMLAVESQTYGGMILMLLSGLPLFGAGLAWGPVAVLIGGISAGAAVLVVTQPALAAGYMLLFAMPVMTLSSLAVRRMGSPGGTWSWPSGAVLVMALTGIGAVLFGLMAVQLAQPGIDPSAVLRGLFEESSKGLFEPGDELKRTMVTQMVNLLAKLPALSVASWLLVLAANGCLGQALAVRFEHQIRPTPAMADLGLPRWFAVLAVLLVAVTVAAPPGWIAFVASNLLVLQCVAYFFAGLGVLHAALQHRRNTLALLLCAYVVIVVLLMAFWPLLLVLVLAGVIEPWAHLRMRLARIRSN